MYIPDPAILTNYARILIDLALGGAGVQGGEEGIRPGDVVQINYDSMAEPLALAVYRRVLERGGHPMTKVYSDPFQKVFYEVARDSQLKFFPEKYMKAHVDVMDHRMYLMADEDPLFLRSVDPAKIMAAQSSKLKMKKWLFEKEDQGKMTWTLCLYGTPGMAREAGLTIEEYWDQIIHACFLDREDPIAEWKSVFSSVEQTKKILNAMEIESLHVTGHQTDLTIKMGEKRKFIGGGGRNIPSFEIFTSPDWRGTEGHIYFDLPLYRYGNIVRDIHLEFHNGEIVKATAGQNEQLLDELISQKNANKVGEYSLTDKRYSRINKFMANTLFDENFGGEFGNTHLAVGSSYHDAYDGDPKGVTDEEWQSLGFNESTEHTDIVATHDRVVTATLRGGVEKVIYQKGEFVI